MKHEYALYKGDTFIDLGSAEYLAAKINVKVGSILFYKSPTYKKRNGERGWVVVEIPEDD